ncbi:MAG TPA: hypothetical protein VJG13_11155 [Thermoanaerobaculia bacterium]|nr:hypothetical protein [Thermoanaerobaculia bacterium]
MSGAFRHILGASAAVLVSIVACAFPAPAEELGRVDFSATGSAEARPHFERGVAALHSFWYDEAREAFRRAREVDPGFVMATWGEAMSHNHPIWDEVELEAGRAALAALAPTAEERAARAPTERERAWLGAVEVLYSGDGEKEDRDRAYAEAMGRLAERFPDLEARAFHALAIEGVVYGGEAEERRFPLLMRAAAELEELFDEHPDHPGVLHYLIHAYDDPVHAPLGLRAARLYAQVAPAAHHALHMPSHIFVQLGRWEEAAASNENAWKASVGWVEHAGHGMGHHDYHSLSWLLYAYLQQGRLEAARGVLDTARRDAEASPGPRVEGARAGMAARHRIETLGMGLSSPLDAALLPGDEERYLPLRLADALAAAAAGDAEAARRAVEALRAEVGEGAEPSVERVMEREATAVLLVAEGKPEEALAAAAEAAEIESALPPPSGPPDTIKPAQELCGELLLALGRPADAAARFEVSLARTPRRALSLLGAARAAAALGERETAAARYRELLEVWRQADPGIPALEEARRYLDS